MKFPLNVFEISSGKCVRSFSGHHDLIYDLCWSADETYLLSASSDGTAKVWYLNAKKNQEPLTLQHTSFVYAAQFRPHSVPPIVATGAYDGIVRVWVLEDMRARDSKDLEVIELVGHTQTVNALAFDPSGTKFFSGDGNGIVKVWTGSLPRFACLFTISSFQVLLP